MLHYYDCIHYSELSHEISYAFFPPFCTFCCCCLSRCNHCFCLVFYVIIKLTPSLCQSSESPLKAFRSETFFIHSIFLASFLLEPSGLLESGLGCLLSLVHVVTPGSPITITQILFTCPLDLPFPFFLSLCLLPCFAGAHSLIAS